MGQHHKTEIKGDGYKAIQRIEPRPLRVKPARIKLEKWLPRHGWTKGDDGIDFSYIIPRDTTIKKEYIKSEDRLNYTFMFPNEVLKSNGKIEDKSVKWSKTVNDLADGNLEMTATIKTKSKICSIFGIELPIILLTGMIFINRKRIKFKKFF